MSATFIFTGGRDYFDEKAVITLIMCLPIAATFAVGDCPTGLDKIVTNYFKDDVLTVYKADWNKHGLAAGPIRNKEMICANPGAIIIAFPGGKGTANCVKQGQENNHLVLQVMER